MSVTPEQIAAWEAQHGPVIILRPPDRSFEVVFRKPTRLEHRQFRSASQNPAKAADAQEALSFQCLIYPDRAAYDALLEKYPGIPDSPAFSSAIMKLNGLGVEEGK